MAVLPNGTDGSPWIIQDIGSNVVIIENPGMDEEKVHLRLSVKRRDLVSNVDKIQTSDTLTANQKKWAGFWYGYFYGYLYTHRTGE